MPSGLGAKQIQLPTLSQSGHISKKALAKRNAWVWPAHQMFWPINCLLVYYFMCIIVASTVKNFFSWNSQNRKTRNVNQGYFIRPSLYSWGMLWDSWRRAEIPPSFVPTRRRGKGSCGCLVSVGCFLQNNSKYVALSCFSVLSTGCHCFLFCSLMELYLNCFTDIKLNF